MEEQYLTLLICLFIFILHIFIHNFLIPNLFLVSIFLTISFVYVIYKTTWKSNRKLAFILVFFLVCFLAVANHKKFGLKDKYFRLSQITIFEPSESNALNYNIFFTETNTSRELLSLKQMCSIESAALNNPNANVFLYSLRANIYPELLDKYKNIRLVFTNPETIYNNTDLFDWWLRKKNDILNSDYWIHDLSDTFRIALLYKYGGYYSDLDTITVRSIESLLDLNGVGYITEIGKPSIGNGILVFQKNHSFLSEAISDVINNYKKSEWGYNGPRLFMRTLKSYCRTQDIYRDLMHDDLKKRGNPSQKCDVGIFPENFFYPINWENVNKMFMKNGLMEIKLFMEAYSVHFYGKFSQNIPVHMKDYSIFEYFAFKNCPYIFSILDKNIISSF
ncbi:unnamed protein product [Brachionus calyciflorus]|uniref:Alpha 1,4-glycosyltransferase domain-containing protein n=1 Tax=Brachionus calyciflorus TaxID=104777 RepID=A0A813X3X7_9BILA|nr:unnamed protein product [Brachionus calyciflorus]